MTNEEKHNAIGGSLVRTLMYLKCCEIEFSAFKGMVAIPTLNHALGQGIRAVNSTTKEAQRHIKSDELNEIITAELESDKAYSIARILEFLFHCDESQLEIIETQFDLAKIKKP